MMEGYHGENLSHPPLDGKDYDEQQSCQNTFPPNPYITPDPTPFSFDNIFEVPMSPINNSSSELHKPFVQRVNFALGSPSTIDEDILRNSNQITCGSRSMNNLKDDANTSGPFNYQHDNHFGNADNSLSLVLHNRQPALYSHDGNQLSLVHNSSPDSDSLFVTSDEDYNVPHNYHSSIYPNLEVQNLSPNRLASQNIFLKDKEIRARSHPQHTAFRHQSRSNDTNTNSTTKGSIQSSSRRFSRKSEPSTPSRLSSIRKPMKPSRKRVAPEEDPENHLIKKLRTQNQLHWGEIVAILNEARIQRGEEPSFTEAAVYGRFKRNAPLIAQAEGNHAFDNDDYMYLRKRKSDVRGCTSGNPLHSNVAAYNGSQASGDGCMQFTVADDRILRRLYDECLCKMMELVADKFQMETGKGFSAQACDERLQNMEA